MSTVQSYTPISDEKTQNVLRLVQSMMKSGNIRKGINESIKSLSKGTSLLVVIACDAEPVELTAFLPIICEDKGVDFIHIPSKSALGVACGIQRPIAACAIYSPRGMEPLRLREKIRDALK